MEPDLLQPMRQAAYRHAYEDGIAEILVGVLLAVTALASFHSVWVLATALVLKRVLERIRDRVITPRTGSATLPERPARQLLGMAAYGVLAGILVAIVRLATADSGAPLGGYRWIPLFMGLFLSGGFLYVTSRAGLKRFYIYLAASVLGGLAMTLSMAGSTRQEAFNALSTLLWGLSALLITIGAVVFVTFLRHNPVLAHEH